MLFADGPECLILNNIIVKAKLYDWQNIFWYRNKIIEIPQVLVMLSVINEDNFSVCRFNHIRSTK